MPSSQFNWGVCARYVDFASKKAVSIRSLGKDCPGYLWLNFFYKGARMYFQDLVRFNLANSWKSTNGCIAPRCACSLNCIQPL